MQVLVLGSGAREHALARALALSAARPEVLVVPGNDGMLDVARTLPASLHDLQALADLARRERIDLTIAGSEEPLVRGVWDVFDARGLRLFGPAAQAAQLEGSKRFAKEFMRRHGIPTARFEVVEDFDRVRGTLARRDYPLVVKADGLAAGKGVHVVETPQEAEASLRAMLVEGRYGEAGRVVVLEEALRGPELSVFAVSDGYTYRILGLAQDHKRAFDEDRGPNTGGMGAYSPVPGAGRELVAEIEARILAPTLAGLVDERMPYRGFLYLGLMLTAAGPQLLEYNCRLGDPEAQVVLPLLQSDFLRLVLAAHEGDASGAELDISPAAAVGVVLASEGYPEAPRTGAPVQGLDAARAAGALVFTAGVRREGDGLRSSGGRICTVVAVAADVAQARGRAYDALQHLHVPGAFYRHDIAQRYLEGVTCRNRGSES